MELPPAEWSAYRARLRDEHAAGWLTRTERDVLIVIATLHLSGDQEPTVRRIALEAACDPRTVRRATAKARARGLLGVEAQFEPVEGQRRQRANRYNLMRPTAPCVPKPRQSKGGQKVRAIQTERKKEANEGCRIPCASLAEIAKRRMATLGLGP